MTGTFEQLTLTCRIDGQNWVVVVPREVAEDDLAAESLAGDEFEDWMQTNTDRLIRSADRKLQQMPQRVGTPVHISLQDLE